MKQTIAACILSSLMLMVFLGCNDQKKHSEILKSKNISEKNNTINAQPQEDDPSADRVIFNITVDQKVYEDSSNFGEPPQIAIWLENPETSKIKTVWVSYRSGSGDWVGKVECPVALPYWYSRFNKEMNTSGPPSFQNPAPVAVTGATPKTDLKVKCSMPSRGIWEYFIEVNVSADFNRTFSSETSQGVPDQHGNGQPSLIYKGLIDAANAKITEPELIGRTDQYYPTDKINPDLQSITTAKNLIKSIEISYHPAKDN